MRDIPPIKKYLAEFIGTLVLVVFGCGTAIAVGCDGTASFGSSYLVTALAFGLALVAMAYSIGGVSGCHINPAVSLAMLVRGRMTPLDFFGYVLAQFLGGAAGALILSLVFGTQRGFAANTLYNNDVVASLLIEAVLTFVFVLTVLSATEREENRAVSGLVVGLSLVLVHVLGIALTGTSVNPARSFGPALLTGGDAMAQVWVFLVGPFVGALFAALVHAVLAPSAARQRRAPRAVEPRPAPEPRRVDAVAAGQPQPSAKQRRADKRKKSAKQPPVEGPIPVPSASPAPAQAQPAAQTPPTPAPTPQAQPAQAPQAQPQPQSQPAQPQAPAYTPPFSPFPFGPSDPYSPFRPYTSRDPFEPGPGAKNPPEDDSRT